MMADYVAQVREQVGMEVPLSADHFGHIGVNSCIRLGKALEKYNMAWLEDMIPWQYTDLLKKITDAVDIPILTGEDIYLKEPFMELCREPRGGHHPSGPGDLRRHSGDQEDRRWRAGVRRADGDALRRHAGLVHGERPLRGGHGELPGAGEPLSGRPWWGDLVEGVEKPIVNKGFITVPDKPGLGVTLNEAVVKQHLHGARLFRADAAVEYGPDQRPLVELRKESDDEKCD